MLFFLLLSLDYRPQTMSTRFLYAVRLVGLYHVSIHENTFQPQTKITIKSLNIIAINNINVDFPKHKK